MSTCRITCFGDASRYQDFLHIIVRDKVRGFINAEPSTSTTASKLEHVEKYELSDQKSAQSLEMSESILHLNHYKCKEFCEPFATKGLVKGCVRIIARDPEAIGRSSARSPTTYRLSQSSELMPRMDAGFSTCIIRQPDSGCPYVHLVRRHSSVLRTSPLWKSWLTWFLGESEPFGLTGLHDIPPQNFWASAS